MTLNIFLSLKLGGQNAIYVRLCHLLFRQEKIIIVRLPFITRLRKVFFSDNGVFMSITFIINYKYKINYFMGVLV